MNIIKHLILVCILLLSSHLNAAEKKLYSSEGYPYKHLLNRAEEIKIIFIENDEQVNCRIRAKILDSFIETEAQSITKESFEVAPFVNCLKRTKAKQLLSISFENRTKTP